MLGPYPDAKFIAVGNLDEQGLLDALDAGAVGVSLGSTVLGLPRPELARLVDRLRARHGAKLPYSKLPYSS